MGGTSVSTSPAGKRGAPSRPETPRRPETPCRAEPAWSGLVGAQHPHGEELRTAPVGVAQRGADVLDLVLAGLAPNLHGHLQEPQHARGPDGVRRQHAPRAVPGDVAAVEGRGPRLGELPTVALLGEPEAL